MLSSSSSSNHLSTYWRESGPNLNLSFHALFRSHTVVSSMGRNGKEQARKRVREAMAVCSDSVPDIEDFSPEESVKIRASLLSWYYENQRILPWRVNQDDKEEELGEGEREIRAYAVWVSEVMLQQTRVSTVISYYNRWMKKWPTARHLAEASQEEVNQMWAGLGYYRRARFLLEGAKSIVEGGEFPTTLSALRKVKGIGDYTAGAISSIAFKEAVPVVDGNVARVISRLKVISTNPKETATIKSFWKLAGQLVDPSRPGDFNQALMELGATICTSTSPRCSECPISDQCRAISISKDCEMVHVTDFPVKVPKVKQRHDFAAVCVVEITDNRDPEIWKTNRESSVFLLVKRPEEGLLAGLWEFPSVLLDGEKTDVHVRRKAMDQYLQKLFKIDMNKERSIILREDIGEYVHIFSHIKLKMYVELLVLSLKGGVKALYAKENQNSIAWKHINGESMQDIGLTSGVRKVYNMIQNFKKESRNATGGRTKRSKKLSS